MKLLVGILVISIFVTQCTSSVALRRRRDSEDTSQDTGVISALSGAVETIESLPIIGGFVTSVRTYISDTINRIQDLTNGAVGRVLGGTMPCEISLENGIKCTGLRNGSDLATLIARVLEQSPLPSFVVTLIETVLKLTLNPALAVAFGGVLTDSV